MAFTYAIAFCVYLSLMDAEGISPRGIQSAFSPSQEIAHTTRLQAQLRKLLSIAPCRCVPLYRKALQLNWIKTLEHESKDSFVVK